MAEHLAVDRQLGRVIDREKLGEFGEPFTAHSGKAIPSQARQGSSTDEVDEKV